MNPFYTNYNHINKIIQRKYEITNIQAPLVFREKSRRHCSLKYRAFLTAVKQESQNTAGFLQRNARRMERIIFLISYFLCIIIVYILFFTLTCCYCAVWLKAYSYYFISLIFIYYNFFHSFFSNCLLFSL